MRRQTRFRFTLKALLSLVTVVCAACAAYARMPPWYFQQALRLLEGIIPGIAFGARLSPSGSGGASWWGRSVAAGAGLLGAIAPFLAPSWQTGLAFVIVSIAYLIISLATVISAKHCRRAFAIGALMPLALVVVGQCIAVYVDVIVLNNSLGQAFFSLAVPETCALWFVATLSGATFAALAFIARRRASG